MRSLAIALLILAAGCGGSSTTEPPRNAEAGTYRLTAVNGALPFVLSDVAGNRHSITNGTLVLDGTSHEFTETYTETFVSSAATNVGTTTLFGSYTIGAGTLTLTLAASLGGGVQQAQWTSGAVSLVDGGRTYSFVRP
jgi:hypothetical protein